MSALEQEIIDRIRRMNEGQQRHILTLLDEVEGAQTIALGEALRQIDTLRLQLEAKYGADHFTSAVDILDEIREERLDDILGSM
ncbi:MAG: hypothetical protein H6672_15155 [Anaerolineaceae bacterium]|nr:hypothetical protein [Anaerolineaceae bacterium]